MPLQGLWRAGRTRPFDRTRGERVQRILAVAAQGPCLPIHPPPHWQHAWGLSSPRWRKLASLPAHAQHAPFTPFEPPNGSIFVPPPASKRAYVSPPPHLPTPSFPFHTALPLWPLDRAAQATCGRAHCALHAACAAVGSNACLAVCLRPCAAPRRPSGPAHVRALLNHTADLAAARLCTSLLSLGAGQPSSSVLRERLAPLCNRLSLEATRSDMWLVRLVVAEGGPRSLAPARRLRRTRGRAKPQAGCSACPPAKPIAQAATPRLQHRPGRPHNHQMKAS